GAFVDLKKGLFVLRTSEAPLLAKAQALLRWHHTSRFCAATGQPTCRNQAGTQRVSSSGSVSYPQVSLDTPPAAPATASSGLCVLLRCLRWPSSWCLTDSGACWPGSRPSLRGMYSALAGFCELGQSQ
ncbi:unnamed protein product, partial [Tetraodon nigroviridis]